MSKMLKVVGASWLQTKISSYILGLLGVLAILALFVGQIERIQEDGTYAATVFYSEKTGYRIEFWGQSNELADIPRGVARAYFSMGIELNGWSTLEVETDGSYPDEIQAYAAGIVEGALTWYLINTHLENTVGAACDNKPIEKQCDRLKDALDLSANVWKKYAAEHEHTDPFWHQVSLYYTQIRGIKTGWQHGIERNQNELETDISDLYWLNSVAEITELQQKLNFSIQDPIIDQMPTLSSAFLKIVNKTLEDGSSSNKLFLAHSSAGSYSSMMRIIKRYQLNYHQTADIKSQQYPGVTVEFSGYPGSITSQDEFYLITGKDHRLAITGTPLRNYNKKMWKDPNFVNITEQVPVGPRIAAANHLATNASSWGHLLARSNSGTGAKQWLVVDFTKLDSINNYEQNNKDTGTNTAMDLVTDISVDGNNKGTKHTVVHRSGGGSRRRGLALLIEQVPARTHSADISDALIENGYWATYGLPLFKDIAEITNTTGMQETYGHIFSEEDSPRAKIFKEHKDATELNSIFKLMRWNNLTKVNNAVNRTGLCFGDERECIFEEDGFFEVTGIRADIVTKYKKPYGIIDTKILSGTSGSKEIKFSAISGPPYTQSIRNSSKSYLNKGTVASIYTDQFDDKPTINGNEFIDLVRQQREEAERKYQEEINKDTVKPFQWSQSDFKDNTPKALPDKWDFTSIVTKWSW